jgi:hypothetical protein
MNEKLYEVVIEIMQVSNHRPAADLSTVALAALVMELRENRKAFAEQMAELRKLIKELTWVLKLASAGHGEV